MPGDGVYRDDLVEPLARVLLNLGCRRGFVVHGSDGMDEMTLTGPTLVAEISEGELKVYTIEPEQFGLARCSLEDLKGGDATENAAIIRAVLAGEQGPKRDVVVLNSAYGLVAAGSAADIETGIAMAREALDLGRAQTVLTELVRMTNL